MEKNHSLFEEWINSNEELFIGPYWEAMNFLEEFNPELLEILEQMEHDASLRAGEHLSVEADALLDQICERIANNQPGRIKTKKFVRKYGSMLAPLGLVLVMGTLKIIRNAH